MGVINFHIRSKPKPESEETTTTDADANNESSFTNEWDAPTSNNVNISSTTNTTTNEWDAPVVDEWSTPVHESAPVTNSEPQQQESSWDTNDQKSSWDEPELTESSTKKEEPETISSLDAKFNSLNVQEETATTPAEEMYVFFSCFSLRGY